MEVLGASIAKESEYLGFEIIGNQIQILPLSPTCVILGKSLNISELQFLHQ